MTQSIPAACEASVYWSVGIGVLSVRTHPVVVKGSGAQGKERVCVWVCVCVCGVCVCVCVGVCECVCKPKEEGVCV